ncbi:MAG: hypothetical protein RRY10_06125, partial [Christensenellaceae bacterium]
IGRHELSINSNDFDRPTSQVESLTQSESLKGAVFHENYHQIAQRMSIIMINKEERSIQI